MKSTPRKARGLQMERHADRRVAPCGKGAAVWLALLLLTAGAATLPAQQLEPRAYSPAPVGTNFFGFVYLYSYGGVALDPSLPIENVNAVGPYYGRTFGFFGRLASITLAAPYAWGTVTGDVMEVTQSTRRSGFGDPTMRFAVNLIGGPVLTPKEFLKRKPQTTLGASLIVSAPYGEYFPSKLINLGTNRWAFKPELGLSYPTGKWTLELYAGVWFFTANNNFYGGQVRTQSPLAAYQAHVVYTINPGTWAAFDSTYYSGGSTTPNGQQKDDRQNNTRGGFTFSKRVTRHQSLKFTWSSGVTARIGSKFRTVGVAWQYLWFDPVKHPAGT